MQNWKLLKEASPMKDMKGLKLAYIFCYNIMFKVLISYAYDGNIFQVLTQNTEKFFLVFFTYYRTVFSIL